MTAASGSASPTSFMRSTRYATTFRHTRSRPNEEHARLRDVEVELDQCWDLLRQRQAKQEFGQDPDTAQVRDARTVEGYQG